MYIKKTLKLEKEVDFQNIENLSLFYSKLQKQVELLYNSYLKNQNINIFSLMYIVFNQQKTKSNFEFNFDNKDGYYGYSLKFSHPKGSINFKNSYKESIFYCQNENHKIDVSPNRELRVPIFKSNKLKLLQNLKISYRLVEKELKLISNILRIGSRDRYYNFYQLESETELDINGLDYLSRTCKSDSFYLLLLLTSKNPTSELLFDYLRENKLISVQMLLSFHENPIISFSNIVKDIPLTIENKEKIFLEVQKLWIDKSPMFSKFLLYGDLTKKLNKSLPTNKIKKV